MSEHHEAPHNEAELREAFHEHDDWFRHSPDEPHHQAAHGDFNPWAVMASLAITVVGVFLTGWFLVGWTTRQIHGSMVQSDRERHAAYTAELAAKSSEWQADLVSEPDWINEKEGTVRLPIERAMRIVIEEYGGQGR